MQAATLYRWLLWILVLSAIGNMTSNAFSMEPRPTPMGEIRTTRWKVVITQRHETFPYSEPGNNFGGWKTETHYQALFDVTLKREGWSNRWSGRAVGSGSATQTCQTGAMTEGHEDLDWTYREKRCPKYGPFITEANIKIDSLIILYDNTAPTEINIGLISNAPRESYGPKHIQFSTIACTYLNITIPGSPASTTTSTTRDYEVGCQYPDHISTRTAPLREGTYEVYRGGDAKSELVENVQFIRLSEGGCADNCIVDSPCLQSHCHEILGCITEGKEGICQPTNKCMLGGCNRFTGRCVETDPVSCTGGDACNAPACDPTIGCNNQPVADGTPCPGIGDNRCRPKPSCMSGSCQPRPPLNGMYDFNPHDCYKNECTNGYEALIPDDTEIPPQASPHVPCDKQICVAGGVLTVGDLTDIPPQVPGNCRRETCDQHGVWSGVIDDSDAPADDPYDCLRYYCHNGEVMAPVPNDTEIPLPGPDGRPRVCRGGEPTE